MSQDDITKVTNDEHDVVETLGEVVRDLRGVELQKDFAARFGKKRTYITNIEGGRQQPEAFVEQLIAAFPQSKRRIQAAYANSLAALPGKPRRHARSIDQRRIDNFIQVGNLPYARRALQDALKEPMPPNERYWFQDRLAGVLWSVSLTDEAFASYADAVVSAQSAGLDEEEIAVRERYAARLQLCNRFEEAHRILDDCLVRHPESSKLWLRQAKVFWYEHVYPEAYAAATSALLHKARRPRVLHARGNILAEWGAYDAAMRDLDEYLTFPDVRPVNAAYAHEARAYVFGMLGDYERAFQLFRRCEPAMETNAWFYYRRGLCYEAHGDRDALISDLQRALELDGPRLNLAKQRHATELLKRYEDRSALV